MIIPGKSTPGAVRDGLVAELSGDMRLLVGEVRGMEGVREPANEMPGMIAGIGAELSADSTARERPAGRIRNEIVRNSAC